MEFTDILAGRRSVKKYDPKHTISDDELKTLFGKVSLSPSSFNLQHWRFIVVRNTQLKSKLRKASWDQEQLETASAVIVVAAKLNAHEDAEQMYWDAPESVRKTMIPMITGFYADKPQMQRDEAVRSASLAAMTLMYAAYDMGYATGPMIGFDPQAVSELVGLDDQHIPVMLIVIGKQVGDMRDRSFRYPLSTTVKLESLTDKGLT